MMNLINQLLNRTPGKYQAKVEIYTWQTCPFCIRAKWLLWRKGVDYVEYKIDGDQTARTKMADRAKGRRSVPQIFINDQHVGGFDDLNSLHQQDSLDRLLVPAT
ncbi:glutaredoxin 3 [Thalassoporum mexicanum PCC 7367]|uniref:glutaredoxin 3 n=1 Tax=Thalassoporum mexicanum TaxID=3457544 RepID=UPI00029FFB86|nr:glutaredoxin 3 [Pseudanabaena sp. PCC 7367]AFY71526.1 glutaredoxin 3 [Pseudanabaena sp. PCC 7367]